MTYSEADLLTVARRICHQPELQFRVLGQRAGMLAVLGARRAEQVVIVLGTGSAKTLIFMVGAALADAKTTILIVPLVALRNDLLGRLRRSGFQPLLWTPETRRTASLVVVAVETACTEPFIDYAQRLVNRQQLDRVIVDEAHLTIMASDYQGAMVQLGWCIGQIRAQNVWLTATLPPSMQDEFVKQNKLVRPRIVRESTNRRNIKYIISVESRNLLECAVDLIRTYWPTHVFDHGRDKIMAYCTYIDDVRDLGAMLDCPTYTSESGT
jgi:superfamily II DNA helicase RecQ